MINAFTFRSIPVSTSEILAALIFSVGELGQSELKAVLAFHFSKWTSPPVDGLASLGGAFLCARAREPRIRILF